MVMNKPLSICLKHFLMHPSDQPLVNWFPTGTKERLLNIQESSEQKMNSETV